MPSTGAWYGAVVLYVYVSASQLVNARTLLAYNIVPVVLLEKPASAVGVPETSVR